MKNSALLRIIIWAVVLVILLAVTGLAIAGFFGFNSIFNFMSINNFSFGSSYQYKDAGSYLTGDFSTDGSSIKKIDLDWIAGSVDISVGDGDEIVVSESGYGDEDQRLRYRIKDGRIDIKFRKSGINLISTLSKELHIKLPAGTVLEEFDVELVSSDFDFNADIAVDEINIDAVSGDINISEVKSDEIEIENVSGDITAFNITANELSADNVSGDIDIRGSVEKVDFNSVSGRLTAEFSEAPKEIEIETVSGSGKITMPKDKGVDVNCDSVSGRVTAWGEKCPKDGNYKLGGGYTKLKVNTVSGDVVIDE